MLNQRIENTLLPSEAAFPNEGLCAPLANRALAGAADPYATPILAMKEPTEHVAPTVQEKSLNVKKAATIALIAAFTIITAIMENVFGYYAYQDLFNNTDLLAALSAFF